MAQTPLSIRRWKRTEYDRLVELGIFDGEPLELIAGQLIVAEPQGSYHAGVINVIADVLRAALPMGLAVRVQSPIALDEDSEPEPDVAVVSGGNADYLAAHPERPLLLVEVADSSLRFDRREKESLYARGGVQDYWIANLVDRVLEVHRTPIQDDAAVYGWSYQTVERLIPGATVALLALPSIRLGVSELLPSV
jgi:Uma2 family endonuclease